MSVRGHRRKAIMVRIMEAVKKVVVVETMNRKVPWGPSKKAKGE
jgi:hypothetical protein